MTLKMRPRGLVLEKKRILPWYDTGPIYICLVLFAMATAAFSLAGLKIALDTPEYNRYLWVPALLLTMSALVFIAGGLRLFYRIYLKLREPV